MDELRELYQEVILDHSKAPHNFGELNPCTHHANGDNPVCGDQISVTLNIENNCVKDIKFNGSGCAISIASTSMMTDIIKDLPTSTLQILFDHFHHICTTDCDPMDHPELDHIDENHFTKMAILSGVRQFPMRVKCATLAWHTLMAAIEHIDTTSTE